MCGVFAVFKKKNKKRERIIRERIREDQFLKYLNMIP